MRAVNSSIPAPAITPYGDHALCVQYAADGFSQPVNDAVHILAARLKDSGIWIDIMTGYDSLVVTFDSARCPLVDARRSLEKTVRDMAQAGILSRLPKRKPRQKTHDIPVFYGNENGPDMDAICKSSGLRAEQVITKHSAQTYRVCMMGFIPGFTFLSEAPKALHHPRHDRPRATVAAGSIGIANWQTGIYGLESPGGWQIIGRTPLQIFDKTRAEPFLISAGDTVRFIPQ